MKIEDIINHLKLQPHPEGGYYKETYRSDESCIHGTRSICTVIYFLLTSENSSKFHRIESDELWYYHAGSPLIVHTLTSKGYDQHIVGNNLLAGETPQLLVPKNTIFGSTVKKTDSFSLVSCSVSPGFEFNDFKLFNKEELIAIYPTHEKIITQLT
jgi:predicted cupin superfamily sugar epimerase